MSAKIELDFETVLDKAANTDLSLRALASLDFHVQGTRFLGRMEYSHLDAVQSVDCQCTTFDNTGYFFSTSGLLTFCSLTSFFDPSKVHFPQENITSFFKYNFTSICEKSYKRQQTGMVRR